MLVVTGIASDVGTVCSLVELTIARLWPVESQRAQVQLDAWV
jgi:hypothetical protein